MKKIVSCFLALITAFSLFSCAKTNPKPQKRYFWGYFNSSNSEMLSVLTDYSGLGKKEFDSLSERFEKELREYHRLYDIYHNYDGINNLKTVNDNAGNGKIKVDQKIIDLLLFGKEMYIFTNGNVNIAMGAVLKIWHDYRAAGTSVPSMAELREANKHTDIKDIVIDAENLTVEILDPKLQIDVGAIAKGYAVEMICEALREDGYTALTADVGGNLKALGAKPNGDGWLTGIKNPSPTPENRYIYTFELKNAATVTSGNYENNYEVDGKLYHHIISPKTLMPSDYYSSVSIITSSSALADALSTAIFNMEPSEAKSFIERKKGLKVVALTTDGNLEIWEGVPHK